MAVVVHHGQGISDLSNPVPPKSCLSGSHHHPSRVLDRKFIKYQKESPFHRQYVLDVNAVVIRLINTV